MEITRNIINSMDDAIGDDATDNAAVKVDEILDKLLDHAIDHEAYGLSARDVYDAIFDPAFAENSITCALSDQNYVTLRETIAHLEQLEAGNTFSDAILSIHATECDGTAHLRKTSLGYEVQLKSIVGLEPWFSDSYNTSKSWL